MITFHGRVRVPQAVVDAAHPIRMLNYKTTTPARFRKNTLTEDIAGPMMDELAAIAGVARERLDYVYFSAARGAEPHTDLLDPAVFTARTLVVPVILPAGRTVIEAQGAEAVAEIGGVYEFDHERTHSMSVEDEESGCVVIMVAIKHAANDDAITDVAA